MTGWYPHTAGHRTLWNPLQLHEPNTMRYLKQAGYEVHWLGKNDCLAPEAFASSVTKIYGPGEGNVGSSENVFKKGEAGYYSFLNTAMDGPPRDALYYERAIEYLQGRKADDAPFFMFLPTSFPHPIYHAPEPWYSMYDPDDLPPLRPVVEEGKPDYHRLIREYRDLNNVAQNHGRLFGHDFVCGSLVGTTARRTGGDGACRGDGGARLFGPRRLGG